MSEHCKLGPCVGALALWILGCGSTVAEREGDASAGSESDAGVEAPVARELHQFHACVAEYFAPAGGPGGAVSPRWTIGVPDRPEIATRVTGADGCADIALLARSEFLVVATKPDWVPVGITVRVGDDNPPRLNARSFEGIPGVPAWWWNGPWHQVCEGADEPNGHLGMTVYDRSDWFDGGEMPNAIPIDSVPSEPILRTAREERTDWLYISRDSPTYCNDRACDAGAGCAPTSTRIMARVRPGMAELEIPGVSCEPTPGGSSLSWPVEGTSNVFRVEVRAGVSTAVLALCELDP